MHTSENGSVKVYDDEDAFHCPHCDEHDILEVQQGIENDDPFDMLDEITEKNEPLAIQNATKANGTVDSVY